MENKFLKAAVFAMMLGAAGSAMAADYVAPSSGGSNSYDKNYSNQIVVGFENVVSGTSASAYGNLNYAIGNYSTAIGFRARTDTNTGKEKGEGATGATAVGNYVTASGNHSVALGSGSTADKITKASGAQSIAIGYLTEATSDSATAFGNAASAAATNSIAIGTKAATQDGADGGIALGSSSSVKAASALAFGTSSTAAAANAMAFGTNSYVAVDAADDDTKQYAIAIGTDSYVKVANAVAIGSNSAVSAYEKNPTDRVVSFGHTEDDTYYDAKEGETAYGDQLTSRLINVTAGKLDTDAVNFSQIKTAARTGNELKNGTYIKSTYTGTGANQSLVKDVTIGTNLEALDAKAAAQGLTVTLATTARDSSNAYKGNNNQIVANDGTVLATFKSSKPGAEATEAEKLAATDFVTNGDVYAAIAARKQQIDLNTAMTRTVNNKQVAGNALVSNDGEVLATFESEKPASLDGKKFVTSGDVFAADVKSGQEVTLDAKTTHDVNGKDIQSNQIATNDGTVLATFTSEKPASLDGTAFVTSGDVFSADTQATQTVTLDAKTTHDVNGKNIQSNQIATNDGTVLATFTSEKPSTLDGTAFVTSGDVFSADTKATQTITLATTKREDVNGKEIKNNEIATNDGTVLATFTSEKPASLDGTAFVTSGDVFSADTKATQTITLDAKTTHDVNGKKIQSNQIATNDGTVLATFTSEKPASLTGTAFVTSGDVYSADTKATQTVTLDAKTTHDVNGKKIQSNQIATNDGTVLATFTSEKPASLTGTAFVTSGDTFAADVKENQSISLSTETTTVNGKAIQKKQIATNEGKVLATFEDATYKEDDKGFVSGGLLWSESIKAGQKPSFAANNNVIKNNDNDVLVTFDEGVVAVAGGAKGAKNTDVNFVSARNAYANDVAYAQTFTLDGDNLSGNFVTNAGATVGTVNIKKGAVESGSNGFVTGDQVWKAIAKYNQVIDFSKKDTTTTDTDSTTPGTDTTDTDADSGKTDTQDSTKTDSRTDSTPTNGNIVTNGDTDSDTGSGSEGEATEGGTTEGGSTEGGTTEGGTTEDGDTTGGDTTGGEGTEGGEQGGTTEGGDQGGDSGDAGNPDSGDSGDQGTGDADKPTTQVLNNKIYANDGTVIAELRQGEVANEDTGFVSGGQVYAEDVKNGQTIDLTNNIIKNNAEDKSLVTFTKAEVKKDDVGFATGGQVWSNAIAADQKVSFADGKNVIKNNDGTTLVTFEHGSVSERNTGLVSGGDVYQHVQTVKTELSNADVASGQTIDATNLAIKNNAGGTLVTFAKGEVKAGNQGFVSGDQVNTVKTELSNADVKSGQTIDLSNNVITNNKGETLVTFTKGEVAKDNAGFVSGGQAYAADIAKNQTIDATNRDIKNNDGKTLVSFTKGAVTEGNQGFVSGDQVNTVKTEINKNIETVKTDLNNQITDVNARVDETNQNLTNLGGQVNEVEERVNKVGAGAAALAALHPMDYDPNAKLTFAVGYGNYRSTSAGAIGAFIRPNNRVMWSLGATMGNGENMYNTGLSFAIGSGKGLRMSRAELDFKVGNLSDQLTQMQTEQQVVERDNAQQDAAILDLHARLKRVEEILAQLETK